MIRLHLHVHEPCLLYFTPLLEKGVEIIVETGCSIRELLCDHLGMRADYLEKRIQTLFLDCRPVDDVDRAVVRDNATIALSAAMPGLLGATMRKGGRYAAFRKDISAGVTPSASNPSQPKGRVTIKCFNMVAKEAGYRLLENGVGVHGRDIQRIVDQRPDMLEHCVVHMYVDGQKTEPHPGTIVSLATHQVELSLSTGSVPSTGGEPNTG